MVTTISSTDLDFTNTERCDPPVLECGENAVGGNVVLFEEDFENIFPKDTFYENFFPIEKNGLNMVKELIKKVEELTGTVLIPPTY